MVGVRRHAGGSRPGGCGGVKTPPYGMSHKRDMAVSVGPGMPGPYGLLFPAAGGRGRLAAHNERRQFATQPRNTRLKGGGRGGGVKNEK